LADVAQFIEVGAAHLIELVPSRLGTVQQSIQAIQICRQAQIGVLLCPTTDPFASQLALAVQPDLIMAFWEPNSQNIAKIYNEMARTIAWHKQNNA
jgi:methylaspartate ammonia-lyase